MVEGTVKFFNRMNHYGFIDGDDGKSYFVHQTGLAEGTQIDEGDRVSFDTSEGDRGPKAENVKKVGNQEEKTEATIEVEPSEASDEATEEAVEESQEEA